MQKNILLVSSSFYPENSPRAFRATELAKEWSRAGHKVTVATFYNSELHESFFESHNLSSINLGMRKWKNIKVSTTPGLSQLTRLIRRSMIQLFEYPNIEIAFRIKKKLKTTANKFDVLVSIAVPYPVHWGVAWTLKSKPELTGKWIADCGDPYMLGTNDSMKKLFYFKYLEHFFSRKATRIVIPKIEMIDTYYKEFHPKIVAISQGFNVENISLSDYTKNEVPTFAFAGTFLHKVRNPLPFIEYLLSKGHPFKFVCYTNNGEILKPYLESHPEYFEVRGYIPREELLFELSKMDFLLNIGFDPIHQMPSKLIDYYLTKRPILSYAHRELPTETIDQFMCGNYEQQLRRPDMSRFDIRNVAKEFLALCE